MWINYLVFIFWGVLFFFFFKPSGILFILLYSELIWIILYVYITVVGTINDDLLLSVSFFLLALAGLEFSTGFLIILFFKNFKKSLSLVNETTILYSTNFLLK